MSTKSAIESAILSDLAEQLKKVALFRKMLLDLGAPTEELDQALTAIATGKASTRNAASATNGSTIKVGELVLYRQGRGTFEAKVTRVDGGEVWMSRTGDGKKISRPEHKVEKAV
jgi:hypothetical protein